MVRDPIVLIVGDMDPKTWLMYFFRTYPDCGVWENGITTLFDHTMIRIETDVINIPDIVLVLSGDDKVIKDHIDIFNEICPVVYLSNNIGSKYMKEYNLYIYARDIFAYIVSILGSDEYTESRDHCIII
jgi:hypothetical protein